LSGERIAILGEPRDGPLAHAIAARGGTIHSSVGLTTTMLVVAADEPYGRLVRASTTFRRAEKAANARALKIVPLRALGLDETGRNGTI
jgi:DNA polymerase-3 subunit epsilon